MRLALFVSLLMVYALQAQSNSSSDDYQELGPMQYRWEHRGDRVFFEVISPDDGWIVLGLNQQDNIVGASLFFGGQRNEEQYFAERYVTGFGENSSFAELGWASKIADVSVTTTADDRERLSFSLPHQPVADYEYDLSPGQSVWLILAYSVSDDLGHHSRFRQHVQVRL
ncbi:MAG: hypothetical protein AAF433_09955 [Bacteroidota bacterium]